MVKPNALLHSLPISSKVEAYVANREVAPRHFNKQNVEKKDFQLNHASP